MPTIPRSLAQLIYFAWRHLADTLLTACLILITLYLTGIIDSVGVGR